MWENWILKTDEPRSSVQRERDTFLSFHFWDSIELNVEVKSNLLAHFCVITFGKTYQQVGIRNPESSN